VLSASFLTLCAAFYGFVRLRDDRPVTYEPIEEHFKYGSTGGERGYKTQFGFGIPYWIWVALPELFPEKLPDGNPGQGYASFGMLYEDGRDPRFDLPVGMSMRRVQGIDRVYFNCAVCHTGSIREGADSEPRFVLGMPANTFRMGDLGVFLGAAAQDWRFQASRVLPKVAELEEERAAADLPEGPYRPEPFSRVDRAIFNYVGVSLMRDQLLTLTSRLSFIDLSTWGPGRVDTFNPPKALLGFPMEHAPRGETMGNADYPAVWNQRWKAGMSLHWDGNNTDVNERNLSAGFGTGATPTTLDKMKLLRVADYLWEDAQPPSFPVERIDAERAASGAALYATYCWSCHGNGAPPFAEPGDGSSVGEVTPIAEIGTDRARLDSYTPALAIAQSSLYAGTPTDEAYCTSSPRDVDRCYPSRFRHFRKTFGYANLPLDGLWLRAPYLHNGSVPTLRDLLEPPGRRPSVFHSGYDVYDYVRVGFETEGPEAEQHGWRFDTRAWGNSNRGHDYGTFLSDAQKDALVEYLKTF